VAMSRSKEELLFYLRERAKVPSDINEHLMFLYKLVAESNAQKIVELGVRGGNSTCALVIAASQTGGFVTSVDHGRGARYSRQPVSWDALEQTSTLITGKLSLGSYWSLVVKDDIAFAREYDDEVDVLMIDTGHSYEQTKKELAAWGDKVVFGGFIILHDTVSFPEQNKAIWEFLDERPCYNYVEHKNCNGLGIIIKEKDGQIVQLSMDVWRYRVDRMQEAIIQMRALLMQATDELNQIKTHSLTYETTHIFVTLTGRMLPSCIKKRLRRSVREGV